MTAKQSDASSHWSDSIPDGSKRDFNNRSNLKSRFSKPQFYYSRVVSIRLENVMSYTSVREFTPYDGKDVVLEERLKMAVATMSKHGSNSTLFKVIIGDRAGDYEIYNWYETVSAGVKSMTSYSNDPDMQAIQAMRAADPIAEIRGPWLGRMIHNNTKGDARMVSVHRDYAVARSDVPKMMDLVPDMQKITDSLNTELAVGVPFIAEDHQMMRVVYRFQDLAHWGESVDSLANNSDFAGLVEKANEIGVLAHSRVLTKLV